VDPTTEYNGLELCGLPVELNTVIPAEAEGSLQE
jgi:hypothetical protein